MVSIKKELKAKSHILVYTKESEEDEQRLVSSYHVTIQNEHDALLQTNIDEELENIVWCYHIFVYENNHIEEEDVGDAPPEFQKEVKTIVDPLKVNLDIDEDQGQLTQVNFQKLMKKFLFINMLK